MDLNQREGLAELKEWIDFCNPDVVVVDTIRSAYPGLSENSADEWAKINKLAVKLRNSGMSVIMLHHSNKPSENGIGRKQVQQPAHRAGNSNACCPSLP